MTGLEAVELQAYADREHDAARNAIEMAVRAGEYPAVNRIANGHCDRAVEAARKLGGQARAMARAEELSAHASRMRARHGRERRPDSYEIRLDGGEILAY